jgi:hypothetical protein
MAGELEPAGLSEERVAIGQAPDQVPDQGGLAGLALGGSATRPPVGQSWSTR